MSTRAVLVADDHPLFRDALSQAVRLADPDARIVHAGSLADTRRALSEDPDIGVVLLDLQMSDTKGLAGLLVLRAEHADTPVAVVSASEDPALVRRALACGAIGFVPKSTSLDIMVDAMRDAIAGRDCTPDDAAPEAVDDEAASRMASLTPAQRRVLSGLLEGRLNKQIAYDMSISEATVKAHVTAVFRKLGVRNRTQAVLAAKALDLMDVPVAAE